MDLTPAHWSKRLGAYTIDLLILIPFAAWWSFGGLFVAWAYFSLFESTKWQATIGKKIMKIKVTDREGKRISFFHSLVKFPLVMLLCWVGSFLYFCNNQRRILSDFCTNTCVVKA